MFSKMGPNHGRLMISAELITPSHYVLFIIEEYAYFSHIFLDNQNVCPLCYV